MEAVIDPKTWILFLFNIAINIPNGGLTTFSGIIIDNLGFSPVITSLLNMPTGVMSTLSAFCFSWFAAKWTNRRCLVTMLASCVPIVGAVLVYSLPRTNIGGQMVGIYLVGSKLPATKLSDGLTPFLSYTHTLVHTLWEFPWLRPTRQATQRNPCSIQFSTLAMPSETLLGRRHFEQIKHPHIRAGSLPCWLATVSASC